MLRFVHISDTHIGPHRNYRVNGVDTAACLEKVLAAIAALPDRPDFLIHTGDVTDDAAKDSYALTADIFKKVDIPCYFVTGNHDDGSLIRAMLRAGPAEMLSTDSGRVVCRFDSGGLRVLILDGRGPPEIGAQGKLPEDQLEQVQNEVLRGDLPLVVLIHFPPIELDCVWLKKEMLLLNGARLHEVLLQAGKKLKGVFFGHVHKGMHINAGGVLYSCVGSTFCQFRGAPSDEKPVLLPGGGCCFNLVSVSADRMIVKEYVV